MTRVLFVLLLVATSARTVRAEPSPAGVERLELAPPAPPLPAMSRLPSTIVWAEQAPDPFPSNANIDPLWLRLVRLGALATASLGVIAIAVSNHEFDSQTTTKKEYVSLRTTNDIGWAVVGVGGAAFAFSFVFSLPRSPSGSTPVVVLGQK